MVLRMQQWTMNQVVAYNLKKARELKGWTQEHAAQALARQQRAKPWSKATWSAAEHSVDGNVVRQFTIDDLIDFSLVFELPPVWWLLPPGSDYRPVQILATYDPEMASGYESQERLLGWVTRPSVEVVSRLRDTGFGAYAQFMDGTPTERLLQVSHELRGVIRLIEEATGVVTVERPDGSTVLRSKEEDDRARRESLEGHRKAHELAKGGRFLSQEEADMWAEQEGYPVRELNPEQRDELLEAWAALVPDELMEAAQMSGKTIPELREAAKEMLSKLTEAEPEPEPVEPNKATPARRPRPA
jgi:transcriptional regulator with XRE-family HTH domain